ncbi:unnamed protein product [Medioppia subpectinata]|uniref:N-acetyltransferase domain-containing protein n=1 Tax=Medioppia subpectinata TaxID=1979941 RepID=A0A7R9KFU5_9ACAR|nr:unnamed protein product [Medioppia subpectinata]CAG2102563.1 unnamed protein product [Medioppia subpectinata]
MTGNHLDITFDRNSLSQLSEWIDTLGEESAKAQRLKQPITSYNRLIDDKSDDKIYLLVKVDQNVTNWSAVGFVRVGTRNLWFADKYNTNLRQYQNCFCILGLHLYEYLNYFYIRNQRQGLGHLLISSVMKCVSTPADQFAYDRPTQAMLSFLCKHFGLQRPVTQHNHFVIFENFVCFDRTLLCSFNNSSLKKYSRLTRR